MIISNTRSFETASTEEINTIAGQQRIRLQEFKTVTAADPTRSEFVDSVGCEGTVKFRRKCADHNIITYRCSTNISTPNVPHIFCLCEALLRIDERRRSFPSDTIIQQRAFDEESFLIAYRSTGLIKAEYIGQYVEIERQRQPKRQVDQFTAFRNSATEQHHTDSSSRENAILERSNSDHE